MRPRAARKVQKSRGVGVEEKLRRMGYTRVHSGVRWRNRLIPGCVLKGLVEKVCVANQTIAATAEAERGWYVVRHRVTLDAETKVRRKSKLGRYVCGGREEERRRVWLSEPCWLRAQEAGILCVSRRTKGGHGITADQQRACIVHDARRASAKVPSCHCTAFGSRWCRVE